MTDNFLYSAETEEGTYTNVVTADDLNNIAIDLGYADYSRFPEEPPQSAVSALNQITQDLTSRGILQIGNRCSVSLSEDKIIVADGVCVFESGAKKRILTPQTLDKIADGTNYIYLLNNEAGNKIELICSIELPSEESDYVMLAEVKGSTVTDRRYWSVSKNNTMGQNVITKISVKLIAWSDEYFEVPIPTTGAKWAITGRRVGEDDWHAHMHYALELEEGKERVLYTDRERTTGFFIKKEDNRLLIKESDAPWYVDGGEEYTVTFYIV
jgi:hypothetical protein